MQPPRGWLKLPQVTPTEPPRTSRLMVRSSLARIAWLFLPLGLLALAGGLVAAAHHTPDAWAGLGLGTLFTGIAVLFLLTRQSLALDLAGRRFRYARGLLHPVREGALDELVQVRIHGRTVPDADLGDEVHYAIDLDTRDGAPITAYDVEDPDEAVTRASILARRLRLPLSDERNALRPVVTPPEGLDQDLGDRLATGAALDLPAPAAVRDGEGTLMLPPPGLGVRLGGLVAGVAVLGAFLVFAHVVASRQGLRVALGFAAYALPFDLVVLWLGSRLLGSAFGREEISVTPETVRIRHRLGRLSVGRRRVELERLQGLRLGDDPPAVRLETDETVLELGRGLDDSGRRWLLARLGTILDRAARTAPGLP